MEAPDTSQARTPDPHGDGTEKPRKRRLPFTRAQRVVLQDMALKMKLSGESYAAIARKLSHPAVVKQLGLPEAYVFAKVTAFGLVERAIAPTLKEVEGSADKLRAIQIAQHEDVLHELWPSRRDPRPAMAIKSHMERIAKLKGLDAPTRVKVEGQVAVTPGIPLSEMTDAELADYEHLVAAVTARKAAKEAAAAAVAEVAAPATAPASEEGGGDAAA